MTRWLDGKELAREIEERIPGAVVRSDEIACYVSPEKLVEVALALRDGPSTDFKHLTNLCGVDYWDRFEVVYHVQSLDQNQIATLKVEVHDRSEPTVPSVVPVWHGAWMQECEAYDLLGIRFEGHPNLHRIMLWEGYPGYPLRKDFLSMPGGLQPGLSEFHGTSRRDPPPVSRLE